MRMCMYVRIYVWGMINTKTRSIKVPTQHTRTHGSTQRRTLTQCFSQVCAFCAFVRIVRFVLFRLVSRDFVVAVVVVALSRKATSGLSCQRPLPNPPTPSCCAWSPSPRQANWFSDVIVVCVALRTFYAHFLRFWGRVSLNLKSREQSKSRNKSTVENS